MWINLFFLFQPVSKLKRSDHEEPSFSLISKNHNVYIKTYLVMYSQAENLLGRKLLKLLIWVPSKPKQIIRHVYWSPINKKVNISMSQSKWVVQKRWLGIKSHLYTKHEISVNFTDKQNNYYAAFTYISKRNENVYTSQGHPNLKEVGSPQTKQCISAYRKKSKETKKGVPEFMLENNIKIETELIAIADEQKKAGKKILEILFYLA